MTGGERARMVALARLVGWGYFAGDLEGWLAQFERKGWAERIEPDPGQYGKATPAGYQELHRLIGMAQEEAGE